MYMKNLCPNLDNEDGLETVLEVPIPEEKNSVPMWHKMRSLMTRDNHHTLSDKWVAVTRASSSAASNDNPLQLVKLIGSACIPHRVQLVQDMTKPIKDGCSIEASSAKYIVHQYLAATGGVSVLDSIDSMHAVGQVNMVVASDLAGNKSFIKRSFEAGSFVLLQKNPDLWCLELLISGHRISGGSDGKISWTQSSSNPSASKGPPRSLRRFFQGLDPRATANLFINTVCIGEKTINGDECFVLKLETSSDVLKGHSTANTEIVHHTIWGCFSHRTGLLTQFEDTKLIRMKSQEEVEVDEEEMVYYETSMVSVIEDYRAVGGINVAHGGRTNASLYRYGKEMKSKWKVEESWKIEEVDFNVCGVAMDCFSPPADGRKDGNGDGENGVSC